jgi:hypothetical protein
VIGATIGSSAAGFFGMGFLRVDFGRIFGTAFFGFTVFAATFFGFTVFIAGLVGLAVFAATFFGFTVFIAGLVGFAFFFAIALFSEKNPGGCPGRSPKTANALRLLAHVIRALALRQGNIRCSQVLAFRGATRPSLATFMTQTRKWGHSERHTRTAFPASSGPTQARKWTAARPTP